VYLWRLFFKRTEKQDFMPRERIVRENAAATAEGAVAEAVQNSPVTLRGSLCILTGYGRCGSAIHQCLKNWGCTIVVYDRDENACERAKEAGAKICEYKDLSKVLKKAAFLFNTAPSAVWTEGLLEGVPQEVCILELASMPGGIDRDAADRLGIHINVLPGLPGRFAPCTSGRLLGEEILKEIERIIKRECKS
jgi:dipicolinate synthase subunit A